MKKTSELFQNIVNNKMTLDEIKEYFNSYQCYITKSDFGRLVSDLIGNVDFKIINEIIKSRKGKMFDDYIDEFGEPILHILVLQLAFSPKINEQKKRIIHFIR